MKLAVLGALPHELKVLLKQMERRTHLADHPYPIVQAGYLNHQIMAATTGVGVHKAREALRSVLDRFRPDLILSVGFAGALYEGATIGDLVAASSVSLVSGSDERTIQIADDGGLREKFCNRTSARTGSFFTLQTLMEKRAVKPLVPPTARFPVCEMETFPLAQLARERGLPFLAVRSITDRLDEEIPAEFLELAASSGWRQSVRASGLLICKPRLLPMAAKLAARSRRASRCLWHAFDSLARAL